MPNPNQIADRVIEEHGVKGALRSVMESVASAHENGDNYGLSIWREVRRVLGEQRNA